MVPRIVVEHKEENSTVSIEIDCGVLLDQKESYVAKLLVFSGPMHEAEKVMESIRLHLFGENKTAKDARLRISKARSGSLAECTPEYKNALYIAVQDWSNDLMRDLTFKKGGY